MNSRTTKLAIRATAFALALALALLAPATAKAAGLRGSAESMESQHDVAIEEKMTFLRKPADVRELVDDGSIVEIKANSDFTLSKVSYPFARPEVKLFIERLAAQHHKETGLMLVVTSLTRPTALQPRNAHKLSVHPAGMAVDFRVPADSRSRAWLENALLGLESERVLDVTRERNPPHYHVAVFPAEYLAYVEKRKPAEDAARAQEKTAEAKTARLAEAAAQRRATSTPVSDPSDGNASTGLMVLGLIGIPGSALLLVRAGQKKRLF